MNALIQRATSLHGMLALPPDKAICHRAVLLAALAAGRTVIRPWPSAEDCQRTLQVVEALGARVARQGDDVSIEGCAGRLRDPGHPLPCGESGTTLRLAAGVLAGQPFVSQLGADASLAGRPMRRIAEPLSRMGAVIHGRSQPAAPGELFAPLVIEGRRPLQAIRYELPVASAQVKSAVLLAGLFADGPTTIVERAPTRDHTERALRAFGAPVRSQGAEVTVTPAALTSPGTLVIPADISSAAFFLVAASCVAGSQLTLTGVSLNPTRAGLVAVLRRMGAAITVEEEGNGWEPRGLLTVRAAPLTATAVEGDEVPGLIDEIPILLVAAACARGTTQFRGLKELRVKETDRIASMLEGLRRLGGRVRPVGEDGLDVEGGPLRGAVVESAGDHRTAMSLAVAGLAAEGATTVQGAECVAKSFPDFFSRLASATASPTVKTVDKP